MFNNLHLYAIILIAVLLIIALAVIYLHNKRITSLTQQLKKNTFELSAMQSVIEGHLIGGSAPLHQDIHMTTTPSNTPLSSTLPSPSELSREQSEYYGDYASHYDGQQYTKSGPNETELTLSTESESSSDLLDEEDLTDYDEEDDNGADELDDILNNFVDDADDVNADNASIVDENDIIEVDNTSENIVVAEVDDDADIDNSEVVEENIIEDVVVEDSDNEEETTEPTTESTADSEPEKKTKKKRTPNTSARNHDIGTIVLSENDNSYYTVYETTTGKKRWRKIKDQSSVNVDTADVLQSELPSELAPIPEDTQLNEIDIDTATE